MGAQHRFLTHTPFLLATFFLLLAPALAGAGDKSEPFMVAQLDNMVRGPGTIGPNWKTVRAFVEKREDEAGIIGFHVEIKDFGRAETIVLQVPREMMKAPNGSMKRGLLPRSTGKAPYEPCYFDGRLEVEVTEFEDKTRLYKITDRTYAKNHPGITPSLLYRVIVPTRNLGNGRSAPIKRDDGTTHCTVNVRFLDGLTVGPNSGEYVDGRDSKICEPWVKLPATGIPTLRETVNNNWLNSFEWNPNKPD